MAAKVGSLALPLTATGTTNDPLEDPTVDLLLAFVGHMLTVNIDPKLADLPGTVSASCPSTKRYGYDYRDPRATHVALKPPGLWIWWDGRSDIVKHTTLRHFRRRQLQMLYVFPELPATSPMNVRRGLMAAVDATMHAAFTSSAGGFRHATFSYNSSSNNAHICRTIATLDQLDIEFLGGRGVPRVAIDDPNTRNVGKHVSGRDFPGYAAVFSVHERIDWVPSTSPTIGANVDIASDGLTVISQRRLPGDAPEPIPE